MADISETEKAYAAGLFDGEGCVQVYLGKGRTGNSLAMAFAVGGSDLRPLAWLLERYGGNMRMSSKMTPIRTDTGTYFSQRPQGIWTVHSKEAEVFANDILPFTLVKREQIELWLYARSLVNARGKRVTPEELKERERVVARCKELKRLG